MVERPPRTIRMNDEEHGKLKFLATKFGVDLGTMISAMVDDARQKGTKFFVSDAYLVPDDRGDVVVSAVSCLTSFLEQQEGLNDSRGYLKLARKKIEEAEFFGEGGSQDDPVLERVAEEEKNEHSD